MTTWKPGARLIHRYNPALGTGRIRAVEGRTVVVEFPGSDTVLRLAAGTDALRPLVFAPGSRAELRPGGETLIVEELPSEETALLTDGREVPQADLWPLDEGESLFDRLARFYDFDDIAQALHDSESGETVKPILRMG